MSKFHYYIYPEGDFENAKETTNAFSAWLWEMFLGIKEILSSTPRRMVRMKIPTSLAHREIAKKIDEDMTNGF